jgi:hypothetical protein
MGRKDIINMISPLLGPSINNMLDKPEEKLATAEKDRDDYKKQLAAMQAAQGGPAPTPQMAPRMKAGGKVSSASKRADGCAVKGKTKGRMV